MHKQIDRMREREREGWGEGEREGERERETDRERERETERERQRERDRERERERERETEKERQTCKIQQLSAGLQALEMSVWISIHSHGSEGKAAVTSKTSTKRTILTQFD